MNSPVVVSAKLTPTSWAALQRAAVTVGDSRTDTINRAVQLYEQLTSAAAQGARVLVQWPDRDESVPLGRDVSDGGQDG